MPQPCRTDTPNSSRNVLIIAGGHAAPPIVVDFSVENLSLFCCMWLIRFIHTVGTAEVLSTFSASISSKRLAPSRPAPGNTSLAPVSGAAYGIPQALTWNIGTIASTALDADRSLVSGSEIAKACRMVDRWLKSTPFGLPVVPDV